MQIFLQPIKDTCGHVQLMHLQDRNRVSKFTHFISHPLCPHVSCLPIQVSLQPIHSNPGGCVTVYTHVHWPLSETECEINSTLSTYIMPQDQNTEFSATVKGIDLLTRFSSYPELSIDVGFHCMYDRKMCVTKEKFMNLICFL